MPDEPEEIYKPWLRDSGGMAAPETAAPSPGQPARQSAAKPAAPRRDVQTLSADELLARPAPLPTDAGPAMGGTAGAGRARGGLDKVTAGLRAANARLEPARRARAAGAAVAQAAGAAYRETRKAAGALGSATANAAGQAAEAAAPKIAEAAEAAIAGLSKTAASARDGLGKGGRAAGRVARAGMGAGAASAKQAVRAAIPERAAPVEPMSELERLVEREGLAAAIAPAPAPIPDRGLPLFGSAPPPPTPTPVMAAASVVPPSAPPAETMQDDEELSRPPVRAYGGGNSAFSPGSLREWARHPASWILAALALTASGFALGRSTGGAGMSDTALGAAIDAHLLANPEIVPQAMERLQANRQATAIGERRATLTTPFSGAWAGDAGGDVTMVVFTDYACTFCRASVPDIERLLRTDPNLKIVFRELPILSADSEAAARVALAAARRGRYMAVHRTLFSAQVPDAAARAAALASTGVTLAEGATSDAAIDRELTSNVELARTLGIDGTPAFVIGDRLLVGAVGFDRLREAIVAARE